MPLATYFVYPPVCICLKDRSYLWKQVRVLSLCAVHQLGPAQHFIFVFPTHTAFARLFVRLLCRFCWVILRGVTHYCTPPPLHVFYISVYYHASSYKTWETPGGSHIILPDDRFRLFHACVCINTAVLTENDALFVNYVIAKALSLFVQFINYFRE